MKAASIIGLISFSLLFSYLAYQEASIWPRGSWTRTTDTPEYVHERYQLSYFSVEDAHKLRRLHNEEALVLLAIILSFVAVAYLSRQARSELSRAGG